MRDPAASKRRTYDFRCSPSPGHAPSPRTMSAVSRRLAPASCSSTACNASSLRASCTFGRTTDAAPRNARIADTCKSRRSSSARSKRNITGPAVTVPSITSSLMTSPPGSTIRCSQRGPRTILTPADCPSNSRARPSVGFKARTASTRGSMAAVHIGNTQAHVCAGSSGKVQPPTRREVGVGCHTGRRQSRQCGIGRTIGRISPQHLPGKRAASPAENGLEGGGIGPAHR